MINRKKNYFCGILLLSIIFNINLVKADTYIGPLISGGSPSGWNTNSSIDPNDFYQTTFTAQATGPVLKLGFVSHDNIEKDCRMALYKSDGTFIASTYGSYGSATSSVGQLHTFELVGSHVGGSSYQHLGDNGSHTTVQSGTKYRIGLTCDSWDDPHNMKIKSLNSSGTSYYINGNGLLNPGNNPNYNGAVTQNNTSYAFFAIIDDTDPTVTITSSTVSDGDTSNDGLIHLTFTLSEFSRSTDWDSETGTTVADSFTVDDVTVSGGSISNFSFNDSNTHNIGPVITATFTPSGEGNKTIDINAGAFKNFVDNGNAAATQFNWTYDVTAPTIAITSSTISDGETSNDSSINLTFTTSEAKTDFVENDISVSGGSISNFSPNSSTVYTATFTPSDIITTIDINAGTFHDLAGNNNIAAPQFNWTYDSTGPSITISSTTVNNGDTSADKFIVVEFITSDATINFNEDDVQISGGSISNFSGSNTSYSANINPSNVGTITINVNANMFTDSVGNGNTAATEFVWTYERLNPFNTAANLAIIETQINDAQRATDSSINSIQSRIDDLKHKAETTYKHNINFNFDSKSEDISELGTKLLNLTNFEKTLNTEWSYWTSGSLTVGSRERTSIKSLIDYNSYNLNIGADKKWGHGYIFGFGIHSIKSENEIGENQNNVNSDTLSLSSYHLINLNNNHSISASLIVGESNFESRRLGTDNTTYYYGNRKGENINFDLNYSLSYNYDKFTFYPEGGLKFGLIKLKKFYESTGNDSLTYDDQHVNISNISLSLLAKYNEQFIYGKYALQPKMKIKLNENLTESSNINAYYTSTPTQLFTKNMKKDYSHSYELILNTDIFYNDNNLGNFLIKKMQADNDTSETSVQLQLTVPFYIE